MQDFKKYTFLYQELNTKHTTFFALHASLFYCVRQENQWGLIFEYIRRFIINVV